MAAPTPTTRVAPTAAKFTNGYQTLITLAIDPNIEFYEKEVTPFGHEGGEPIMTGDMFNQVYETKVPQALQDTTEATVLVNWSPLVLANIIAAINEPTTVTIKLPTGHKYAYYGYLRSFKPGVFKKGEQPTATIVLVSTNTDPSDGSEAGPSVTNPS